MKRDAVDLYIKTAPKKILHAVRYVGMMAPRGPLDFSIENRRAEVPTGAC